MIEINRFIAAIHPTHLLEKWVNNLEEHKGNPFTLEALQSDITHILIPLFDSEEGALAYIDKISDSIFEYELSSWSHDREIWPPNRSNVIFHEWFDINIHSLVLDTVKEDEN